MNEVLPYIDRIVEAMPQRVLVIAIAGQSVLTVSATAAFPTAPLFAAPALAAATSLTSGPPPGTTFDTWPVYLPLD